MKDHKSSAVVVNKTTLTVAIMLIAVLLLSGCNSADALRKELYSKAQAQMLLELKSPSTAKFSPDFDVKKFVLKGDPNEAFNICGKEVSMDEPLSERYEGDNYNKYHEVSFWVDAENSYGAMLRTDYNCIVDLYDDVVCRTTETANDVKEVFCL